MSSVKFESSVSAEEVRKMTTQWGYHIASTPRPAAARPSVSDTPDERREIMWKTMNSVINAASMLAGATTTVIVIAYLVTVMNPQ